MDLINEYLSYLSTPVLNRDGILKPRVRHPKKWNIESSSVSGLYIDVQNEILKGRTVWIWSDHHFYHNNIINFSDRPYETVEEMNQAMIDIYKDTVKDGDICIWAGDITFKSTTLFNEEIYPNFNKTYNILVVGNHDFNGKKIRDLNFDEVHLGLEIKLLNKNIIITHIPFTYNDNNFINVHGHIHNGISDYDHQINVSIEALDFKPQKLLDLIKKHVN